MPNTQTADTTRPFPQGSSSFLTVANTLVATGPTDMIKVVGGGLTVSIDGVGTSVTAQVQRSIDGGVTWHWPVGTSVFTTADANTGVAALHFAEDGIAWYRVNVSALTGASVQVAMTGKCAA